jgi:hypothetical protein
MNIILSCLFSFFGLVCSTNKNWDDYHHFGKLKTVKPVSWSRIKHHPFLSSKKDIPEKDDIFILELDAYNFTFCIHLFPNTNLLHSEATFQEYGSKPRKLDRKVFKGHITSVHDHRHLPEYYTCNWDSHSDKDFEEYNDTHGWARFMLTDKAYLAIRKNGLLHMTPEFEGVFVLDSHINGPNIYTVKTLDKYISSARSKDVKFILNEKRSIPEFEYGRPSLVIYRSSDFVNEQSALMEKISHSPDFCGHESEHWNVEDGHQFYETKLTKMKRFDDGCQVEKKILYMVFSF